MNAPADVDRACRRKCRAAPASAHPARRGRVRTPLASSVSPPPVHLRDGLSGDGRPPSAGATGRRDWHRLRGPQDATSSHNTPRPLRPARTRSPPPRARVRPPRSAPLGALLLALLACERRIRRCGAFEQLPFPRCSDIRCSRSIFDSSVLARSRLPSGCGAPLVDLDAVLSVVRIWLKSRREIAPRLAGAIGPSFSLIRS